MKSTNQWIVVAVALVVLAACGGGSVPSQSSATPARSPALATRTPSLPIPASPSVTLLPATPEASAQVTAPASPVAGVPDELQFRWIGPLRDVPQITPKSNFTGLEMGSHTTWYYAYTQGDGPDLRSNTSSPADGELTFITVADAAGCHLNDTGTYTYKLNVPGTRLTLTPLSDPCEARKTAFSGDWTRSACPDPGGWCLGDLGPGGDFVTAVFTPFVSQFDWHYDYGEMSYTVPAGWSNHEDSPGGYVLAQRNAPEFAAIYAFADVLAHSQAEGCPEEPDTTVGTSAADLTDWLTNLPSVATTKPRPVTIGGLSGYTIDVSVDPGWTRICPNYPSSPGAPLFSSADPRHGFDWGLAGDGRMRLFLLTLPDDRTLLLDIESTDKQTWDALVPVAMPVVESFTFSQ